MTPVTPMSTPINPFNNQHVLVVMPCATDLLAQVHRDAKRVSKWTAQALKPGFGETGVAAVMAVLAQIGPDLLVSPTPHAAQPAQRALALNCIEACRRSSDMVCMWPTESATAAQTNSNPVWTRAAGEQLTENLLTALQGPFADADSLLHEPLDPGLGLISVIVRSMDRETLNAALDSIVMQTYRPIEVVLVNALGAAHRPLPNTYRGLPLVLVEDLGRALPRARAANLGLGAASGSLQIFLDDDDVFLPDHLSRLAHALRQTPAAGAAYADVELGRIVAKKWQASHLFGGEFDAIRLRFENHLAIHAVLFRRPASVAELSFDERFDLFEDWDFWLQLAASTKLVHVPGISARYVTTQASQSEVFEDSAATRQAREQLYEKWRQRSTAQQHAALMHRLQSVYREAAQSSAQLKLLRSGQSALQSLVQARDTDISNAATMLKGLHDVLAARESDISNAAIQSQALQEQLAARAQEIGNALRQVANLQGTLAAREREAADALVQMNALKLITAAREREIEQTALQHAGLQDILAARERQIASAETQICAITAVLKERDREIADAAIQLHETQNVVAARDQEIASAQAQFNALTVVVQAREREIADTSRQLTEAQTDLARCMQEIAAATLKTSALHATIEEQERAISHAASLLQKRDTTVSQQAQTILAAQSELSVMKAQVANQSAALAGLHAESPFEALVRTMKKKRHAL